MLRNTPGGVDADERASLGHCQLNSGSAALSSPGGREISQATGFFTRSGMGRRHTGLEFDIQWEGLEHRFLKLTMPQVRRDSQNSSKPPSTDGPHHGKRKPPTEARQEQRYRNLRERCCREDNSLILLRSREHLAGPRARQNSSPPPYGFHWVTNLTLGFCLAAPGGPAC